MIDEAPRGVKTAEYYSFRRPIGMGLSPEVEGRLIVADPIVTHAERFLKPFERPIGNNKLRVVHKGVEPYSPMDAVRNFVMDVSGKPVAEVAKKEVKKNRAGQLVDSQDRPVEQVKEKDQFLAEAREVIAFYTHDLFDDHNRVKPESERTWKNVTEITPKLVEILVNHGGYGDSVEKSHALNILAASLQMVRDPQTKMALKVGIGGSDSPFTSARFLAYGVPALNVVQEIQDFYEERENRVLRDAVVAKTADTEDKKLVRQEVAQLIKDRGVEALVTEGRLTRAEFDQVLTDYAILKTAPTVQFVCTPEAAIYANFQGKEAAVRERTQDQVSHLRGFVGGYYPDIASHVYYLTDIPWEQHSPQTRGVIKFLAQHISTHPDTTAFVDSLRGSGFTHGGEEGANRTVDYIAMHRLAFEDQNGEIPNPPYIDYPTAEIQGSTEADINLTSGCRSETRFNAPRTVMAEASLADFESHLRHELTGSEDLDELLSWIREDRRKKETDLLDPKRPFRAKMDIHAIHDLSGYKPPYYTVPGLDIHVAELDRLREHTEKLPHMAEGMELVNGHGPLDPKAKQRAVRALIRDNEALLAVVEGRN